MAINRIEVAASPEAVFDVLDDPFSYADWVVGTGEITEADPEWPRVGSSFDYRIGFPPAVWRGSTEIVAYEQNRLVSLRTLLPIGPVVIHIEIETTEAGSCVTLTEGPELRLMQQALDPGLHVRNAQTLANLKALVEGRTPGLLDPVSALAPGPHWLSVPGFADVLNEADRCHLAIETKSGPHVTPTAYTTSSGRFWMLVDRSSLKARVLAKRSRTGIVVRAGERSVVVSGEAELVDPLRFLIPEHLVARLQAGPALLRYLAGNRDRLRGYLSGSLKSLPLLNPAKRILVSVAPRSALLVEGDRVVDRRGQRSEGSALRHLRSASGKGAALDLDIVPDAVTELAEEGRSPAVVAWGSPSGPLALPAHWHATRRLASVPAVLLQGMTEAPAALCLETEDDSTLDDLEGMVVRGQGRVRGVRGGYAAIEIDSDKTTAWSGTGTKTVRR